MNSFPKKLDFVPDTVTSVEEVVNLLKHTTLGGVVVKTAADMEAFAPIAHHFKEVPLHTRKEILAQMVQHENALQQLEGQMGSLAEKDSNQEADPDGNSEPAAATQAGDSEGDTADEQTH